MAAANRCTICDTPDARLCNQCKSTRYCSKICQQQDWPCHKLLCDTFSKFDIVSRPSDEHYRAILFPVDERKPRVVWLRSPWREDDEDGRYQNPQVMPFLGPNTSLKQSPIQSNNELNRKLENSIFVCYRDAFLLDGSENNKSIHSLNEITRAQYHDWRGPMLAYGMIGLGIDPRESRDVNMNDFRHIADYFVSYGRAAKRELQ